MAILCREHDLLYIRVPATGSSVVAVALQNQLGGERVPAQPVRREGQTVVQNPFDRWTTYCQRRAGTEWIESSLDVLRRQLERDRNAHDLSDSAYEQRRRDIEQWKRQQKRKGRLMRWVGFNTWMTYTLLRWGWKAGGGNNHEIGEYAFPMLSGVDVAIRQERLNEGLNRVLGAAGVREGWSCQRKTRWAGRNRTPSTTRGRPARWWNECLPLRWKSSALILRGVDDEGVIFLEGK
jgi:hypothetical protein